MNVSLRHYVELFKSWTKSDEDKIEHMKSENSEENEKITFTPSPCGLFENSNLETPFFSPKIL